ncbi:MAG: thiamine-phosphate kinase [Thermodesulforhabdaceae bacterium]
MEETVKTLADVGEFGFIEILRSKFPVSTHSGIIVGIGDDVAVIDVGTSEYLLVTCDAQIGDVHFPVELISPYDLGCRIVEVNASDVAAMGGMPRWALVGLNVPAHTSLKFLEEFYAGVGDSLSHMEAHLVGGNCARTKQELVIDLFLVGSVPKNQLIKRRGASAGDIVFVTGTLGKARAGLEVVLEKEIAANIDKNIIDQARRLFFRPKARIIEGRRLAQSRCVTAMIDISDGLLQDIGHLARENQLDVVLDISKIPVDPICEEIAKIKGVDPLLWALTGGEDYELLFAVPEKQVSKLMEQDFRFETETPITSIGFFLEGSGRVFLRDRDGKTIPSEVFISKGGWDHFRGGKA